MNDEDKIILKESLYVVADSLASKIPGLDIAWGLSKTLLESSMKLRQQRVFEWVEMVRNNPNVFVKQIVETEEFQNAFVYSLGKYLVIRGNSKRIIAKNIFIGYSNDSNKEQFELERFYQTLEAISYKSLKALAIVGNRIVPHIQKIGQYHLYDSISNSLFELMFQENKSSRAETEEIINELLSLGLFKINFEENQGEYPAELQYGIGKFGLDFIEYINY